ncbi:hypothetical protein DPMN_018260 [Dreissena polymorpha]|uniref:Uncharacterized protein n=1 Tax=Dreissena polymorpha TaxID=45954 RepID=A0A9D4NJ17_DREPO|nr:hypothetical protein DPMN_018260 [Dreissena polymorpha]
MAFATSIKPEQPASNLQSVQVLGCLLLIMPSVIEVFTLTACGCDDGADGAAAAAAAGAADDDDEESHAKNHPDKNFI